MFKVFKHGWFSRRGLLRIAAALTGLSGILLAFWPAAAQQQDPQFAANGLPEVAVRQIQSSVLAKNQRSPAQLKLSSTLLHERRRRRGETIVDGVTLRSGRLPVSSDGMVEVDLNTRVTAAVLQRIGEVGGAVINSAPSHEAMRARVPLDSVESIAELSDVRSIRPADLMINRRQNPANRNAPSRSASFDNAVFNKVDVSQGDIAHRAAIARALFGVDGSGIGIGVMSNGINTLAARQGTGDLPAVTVLPGQAGFGDEGTAMLEIVHDLAPGANLFFATANSGEAQFATNIEALCNAGARVIVDDVFYFREAAFQDGIAAKGVNNAVGQGCFYFSAGGNGGNITHGSAGVWEGDFVPSNSSPLPPIAGGVAHSFSGSNSNQVTNGNSMGFALQWADPLGAASNDYDLYLFDSTLTTLLDVSDDVQNGFQDPIEFICSSACGFNDTNNRLVIVRYSGDARYLRLDTIDGRLAIKTSGAAVGHSAAANTIGVTAVNVTTAGGGSFSGGSANPVALYSSDGPRRIFFNPNGAAITPGNFLSQGGRVLQKPDIAAADCVSTSTPGFSPFCGTSASAPHVAAIAALVLQAKGGASSMNAGELRQTLFARAIDIEANGVDRDSGAGIVDALGSIAWTSVPFFDAALASGELIRAAHITQLRNRIDGQRQRCRLPNFPWTDPSLTAGVTSIKAVHITDMRTALTAAFTACGLINPTYTDPTIVPGQTVAKSVHISELRNAVVNLETGIRIVLTWDAAPRDLDLHFTGPLPGGTRFHLFSENADTLAGSPWPAFVHADVDALSGFGPETITLVQQIAGVYRLSVHDHTNAGATSGTALAQSNAQVRVYRGGSLLTTFNVPTGQQGTLWTVFELNGSAIQPINTMSFVTSPASVQ